MLQRSQRKHRQPTHSAAGKTRTTPFPRSEIIQNLSVFASLLETGLHIRDGNYGIAKRGLDAIRNILDRVLSCDDDDDNGGQPERQQQQQQQEQKPYKIIPDPGMARFASPAASQGQFDSMQPTQQLQQEIPASQQQQQQQQQHPSIMMPDTSITTSFAPAASITPNGLAPGAGADGSINTNDNFLPVEFMSWLDSFDWAQESLLNYS